MGVQVAGENWGVWLSGAFLACNVHLAACLQGVLAVIAERAMSLSIHTSSSSEQVSSKSNQEDPMLSVGNSLT